MSFVELHFGHGIVQCSPTLTSTQDLFQQISTDIITEAKLQKPVNNTDYMEIKCHLDATEVFIPDHIACSTCFVHHYVYHGELNGFIQ